MKALLSLCLIVLATTSTGAVELKLKWQPGKRYVFEQTADSAMKLPLPGQGPVETKSKMAMTMTHDASADPKGLRVGVAFRSLRMMTEMAGAMIEYDSEDPVKSGGALGPVLQPLKDAKYASIFDQHGKLLEVEGLDEIKAPGQMGLGNAELEAMARQSAELMPGKDVNPGDAWDAEVSLPLGGLGDDLALKYTLKLEGVEEVDGKSVARVTITGQMKEAIKEDGEAVLAVEVKKLTGLMLFDIELGQPTELQTTVELEMALPAGVPVEEGAPGRMPVTSTSVQKLLSVEDLPKETGAKTDAEPK